MAKINLAGCVIIKDQSILLIKRKKTQWYELPGGKIEKNETSESAAIRELKEELQVDIKILRTLGIKSFIEGDHAMTYVWFLSEIKDNQSPTIGEPDKFSELKYIAFAELNKTNLSPNMKNFFRELSKLNLKA